MGLPGVSHAATWPASSSGSDIGGPILASIGDFEPSGIVWHSGRGTLVVVGDGGDVAEIELDGTLVDIWSPGHNWESVTLADPGGSVVYLGSENDSIIYGFDLDTGALTGDEWDISATIYLDGPLGFEALTWVPDGHHGYGATVSGGLFYAGWQLDADIYVFEPDLSSSGTITYLDEISTTSGYSDLSGLSFCEGTGTIFAVYDAADRLEELETGAASPLATYAVPDSGAWEGVVVVDDCPTAETGTISFADDAGAVVSYASMTLTCLVVDADGDGASREDDCDDGDGSVSVESTFYADADGDGYGDPAAASLSCGADSGTVTNSSDCDDSSAAIHPGATEACDAADTDEDCDGLADDLDAAATGASTWHRDSDGDGYGSTTTLTACDLPSGYTADPDDCDDGDAAVNPGQVEVCDPAHVDEDCNGVADDDDGAATGTTTWFLDADGDGYGASTSTAACELPAGYAAVDTDCDDASAAVHPVAVEVCNLVDDDCDGGVDLEALDALQWAADADGDGFTVDTDIVDACDRPDGLSALTEADCDDGDPDAWPGAPEVADDGVDQDCDGVDSEAAGDSGGPGDSGDGGSSDGGGTDPLDPGAASDVGGRCGCATRSTGSAGRLTPLLLLAVGWMRRRRPPQVGTPIGHSTGCEGT